MGRDDQVPQSANPPRRRW